MDGRCGSCKFWKRVSDKFDVEYHGAHAGRCSNDRFVYRGDGGGVPVDGLAYWDYEGYSAGFETGESFGCPHWATAAFAEATQPDAEEDLRHLPGFGVAT